MTKRAFSYIWARTPNLRRIKVSAFHMHGDLHARILSRLRDSLNLIPLGRDNFTQPRGNTFLQVSALVMNDDFPHDSRVEFDEDELMRLLRANPMRHLEKMDANITLKERRDNF